MRGLLGIRWSRGLEIATVVVFVTALVLLLAPVALGASGNDIGQNIGDLLRQYAGEIYGGVVALFSLVFLVNRRYGELVMFLLAAVAVAWMVFSPDSVAKAGRSIGKRLFG